MLIGGLDIGTTGCKLTLFDGDGKYVDHAYRSYPLTRVRDRHEIDPSALLEGVYHVFRELTQRHRDIAGVGVTSFGETFLLCDRQGTPLLPAMLYTDPRGSEECAELVEKLGGEHIAEVTGLRPHEMYSLPKIMWVKKHRPDLFQRAGHIFLVEDFVVHALTGRAQIDYSLATRTMAFDIRKLSWSDEMLSAAGIDPTLFSTPVPTGSPAGSVTAEAAARTGLDRSAVIVSISHDQVAAAVGSGVFEQGMAVDGAGTVECITPVFGEIPESGMYDGHYCVVPYLNGGYVSYAFSYTGGALIQWFIDSLCAKEKELAEAEGISPNALLERRITDSGLAGKPTGLLVLPHFAGAATPYMDTGSKGAIVGLTASTSLEEIYLACMEGVAYEMLINTGRLRGAGIGYTSLYATGGGARSALWMQMKADILGVPITALGTADAGTVGSAMLTGVAVGAFPDLKSAAAAMVEKREVYLPDPARHDEYMKHYRRYAKLYDAVRPLVEEEL